MTFHIKTIMNNHNSLVLSLSHSHRAKNDFFSKEMGHCWYDCHILAEMKKWESFTLRLHWDIKERTKWRTCRLTSYVIYRTRAIITRSWFETALDYKPRVFKVRKVPMHYKPLCNINRGLYNYQKLKNSNSNICCKSLPIVFLTY